MNLPLCYLSRYYSACRYLKLSNYDISWIDRNNSTNSNHQIITIDMTVKMNSLRNWTEVRRVFQHFRSISWTCSTNSANKPSWKNYGHYINCALTESFHNLARKKKRANKAWMETDCNRWWSLNLPTSLFLWRISILCLTFHFMLFGRRVKISQFWTFHYLNSYYKNFYFFNHLCCCF